MPNTTADTFTNYLRRQVHRQDRVGDFARDWFSDGGQFSKPRGRYSWRSVRAYLERNNACEPAIASARKAWTEWLKIPCDDAVFELPKLLIKHGVLHPETINSDMNARLLGVQNDLAAMLTPSFD
jgi:hypothetical protein